MELSVGQSFLILGWKSVAEQYHKSGAHGLEAPSLLHECAWQGLHLFLLVRGLFCVQQPERVLKSEWWHIIRGLLQVTVLKSLGFVAALWRYGPIKILNPASPATVSQGQIWLQAGLLENIYRFVSEPLLWRLGCMLPVSQSQSLSLFLNLWVVLWRIFTEKRLLSGPVGPGINDLLKPLWSGFFWNRIKYFILNFTWRHGHIQRLQALENVANAKECRPGKTH